MNIFRRGFEFLGIKSKTNTTTGIEGGDFQLNIILFSLLRAAYIYPHFEIESELQGAGKFDDVVLSYTQKAKNEDSVIENKDSKPGNLKKSKKQTNISAVTTDTQDSNDVRRYILVQAKHTVDENKTVTLDDFIDGEKFNIEKYFTSFKEIIKDEKMKEGVEHLILFSNLKLNKDLEKYVEEKPLDNFMFNFLNAEKEINKPPQLYQWNSKFIQDFKYCKIKKLAKLFAHLCLQHKPIKETTNFLKEHQCLLANEVVDIETKRFRPEFIEAESESEVIREFNRLFLKELTMKSIPEKIEWMKSVSLNLSPNFGKTDKDEKSLSIIEDEEEQLLFEMFCSRLVLAFNQPNEKQLEYYIHIECRQYFDTEIRELAVGDLLRRVRRWFKEKKGEFNLKKEWLIDAINEIGKNEKDLVVVAQNKTSVVELLSLDIDFINIRFADDLRNFFNKKKKKLLGIHTAGSLSITTNKVIQSLEKQAISDYIYCNRMIKREFEELYHTFKNSNEYNLFICKIDVEEYGTELSRSLLESAQYLRKEKQIIIVCSNYAKNILNFAEFQLIEDYTEFNDLTEETQKRLNAKEVIFQGEPIEIYKITKTQSFPANHRDEESWGDLVLEEVTIGREIDETKDYNSAYYINRTMVAERPRLKLSKIEQIDDFIIAYDEVDFQTKCQESPDKNVQLLKKVDADVLLWQNSSGGLKTMQELKIDTESHAITDNAIDLLSQFDRMKPVFLLSDPAGMGKSTVSSHLAKTLKQQNRHYWVIRLESSEYISELSAFNSTISPSVEHDVQQDSVYDEFIMNKLLKLSTSLERSIFDQYLKNEEAKSKLIVIFDGFDEINEICRTNIIKILIYLSQKTNVRFIGITTRPNYLSELEEAFQEIPYILTPFSEDNQIDFLKKFWLSKKDGIRESMKHKVESQARRIIKMLSGSLNKKNSQLTGVPLLMRMIAEIYDFEDHAKLTGFGLTLFDLYEKFIKKKEEIHSIEKTNIKGLAVDEKIIKLLSENQTKYARKTVLKQHIEVEISEIELETTIYLGIIQKKENLYQFIHLTFAEFLTAKYIREYIINDKIPVFNRIKEIHLITVLKDKQLAQVRKFLDCKLDPAKLLTEFKATDDFVKVEIQEAFRESCGEIVNKSAEEGTLTILSFALEMYWWSRAEQMQEIDLSFLQNAFHSSKPLDTILQWLIEKWKIADKEQLRKTFKFLLGSVLITTEIDNDNKDEVIVSLIKFQDKLITSENILTETNLKVIALQFRENYHEKKFWNALSIEYLRDLQNKYPDIFHAFLNQNQDYIWRQKIYSKKYLDGIFDESPVPTTDSLQKSLEEFLGDYTAKWQVENLILYLDVLYHVVENYLPDNLKVFQTYLEDFIPGPAFDLSSEFANIYLEFLMKIRHKIPIDAALHNMKINKEISFIENCALLSNENMLRQILDAEDIESELMAKLKLQRTSDLKLEKIQILKYTQSNHFDYFMKSMSERSSNKNTVLAYAILTKDETTVNVIAPLLETEELFLRILSDVNVFNSVEFELLLKFVDDKVPQFIYQFIAANKDQFIENVTKCDIIFQILGNNQKVSSTQFMKILTLQHTNRGSLLHEVLWNVDANYLSKWLDLVDLNCSDPENISNLFECINARGDTVIDSIKYNAGSDDVIMKRKILFKFFDKLKLEGVMNKYNLKFEYEVELKSEPGEEPKPESEIGEEPHTELDAEPKEEVIESGSNEQSKDVSSADQILDFSVPKSILPKKKK